MYTAPPLFLLLLATLSTPQTVSAGRDWVPLLHEIDKAVTAVQNCSDMSQHEIEANVTLVAVIKDLDAPEDRVAAIFERIPDYMKVIWLYRIDPPAAILPIVAARPDKIKLVQVRWQTLEQMIITGLEFVNTPFVYLLDQFLVPGKCCVENALRMILQLDVPVVQSLTLETTQDEENDSVMIHGDFGCPHRCWLTDQNKPLVTGSGTIQTIYKVNHTISQQYHTPCGIELHTLIISTRLARELPAIPYPIASEGDWMWVWSHLHDNLDTNTAWVIAHSSVTLYPRRFALSPPRPLSVAGYLVRSNLGVFIEAIEYVATNHHYIYAPYLLAGATEPTMRIYFREQMEFIVGEHSEAGSSTNGVYEEQLLLAVGLFSVTEGTFHVRCGNAAHTGGSLPFYSASSNSSYSVEESKVSFAQFVDNVENHFQFCDEVRIDTLQYPHQLTGLLLHKMPGAAIENRKRPFFYDTEHHYRSFGDPTGAELTGNLPVACAWNKTYSDKVVNQAWRKEILRHTKDQSVMCWTFETHQVWLSATEQVPVMVVFAVKAADGTVHACYRSPTKGEGLRWKRKFMAMKAVHKIPAISDHWWPLPNAETGAELLAWTHTWRWHTKLPT